MIYYLLYIMIILNIYVELSSSKYKNIFTILSLFLLSFILGAKYQIGVDWYAYEYWYNLDTYNLSSARTEPGLKFIITLSNNLGIDYYTFNFLITSLSLLVFYKFWRKHLGLVIIPFVLLFYKGYGGLLFDQTRQLIAFSISLLVINFLLKREILSYLSSILIASLFHTSSIIFLIYYFIKKIKFKKITLIFLYLIGFILALFHIDLFSFIPTLIKSLNLMDISAIGKIFRYMSREPFSFFTFGSIEKLILFCFYIFVLNKNSYNSDDKYRFFYNLGLLYFFVSLYFFNYPTMSARLSVYFFIGVAYIFSVYIITFPKQATALIISLYFTFMSILYFRNMEYISMISPYKNYYINAVMLDECDINKNKVEEYWGKAPNAPYFLKQ